MTITCLKILCIYVSHASTFAPKRTFSDNKNITMLYAMENEVFARRIGVSPDKFQTFSGNVTGLALHKDYLYITTRKSKSENSTVWRTKSINSFQVFHRVNAINGDISSMVIVKDQRLTLFGLPMREKCISVL